MFWSSLTTTLGLGPLKINGLQFLSVRQIDKGVNTPRGLSSSDHPECLPPDKLSSIWTNAYQEEIAKQLFGPLFSLRFSARESQVRGENLFQTLTRSIKHFGLFSVGRFASVEIASAFHFAHNLFLGWESSLQMRRGGRRNQNGNVRNFRNQRAVVNQGMVEAIQELRGAVDGMQEQQRQVIAPAPPREVVNHALNDRADFNRLVEKEDLTFEHDPKPVLVTSVPSDCAWNEFVSMFEPFLRRYDWLIDPALRLLTGRNCINIYNKLLIMEHTEERRPDRYNVMFGDMDHVWTDRDLRSDVHRVGDFSHSAKLATVISAVVTQFSEEKKKRCLRNGEHIAADYGFERVQLADVVNTTFPIDAELFSQLLGPNIGIHASDFEVKRDTAVRYVKRSTEINLDRYLVFEGHNIPDNTLHVALCYYRWLDTNRISSVAQDFRIASHPAVELLCFLTVQEKSLLLQSTLRQNPASSSKMSETSNSRFIRMLRWSVPAFMLMATVYLMWTPRTLCHCLTALNIGWGG